MCRKGENIFLRKDGRWEARYIKYYDDYNRAVYGYVYAKTYKEVKNKKNIMLIKNNHSKERGYKKYLIDYIDIWLLSKSLSVKKSTLYQYETTINKFIIPYFKNIKLDKIDNIFLNKYLVNIKEEYNLSDKSIKDIFVILKQMLKFCDINIDYKLPKTEKRKIKILSQEDQKKLEKYLSNNDSNASLGILLSLYCGLRIGEVCALKWKDIDFERHMLVIGKTLIRIKNDNIDSNCKTVLILDNPKTENSIREIPLPSFLYEILIKKRKSEDNFVITNSNTMLSTRTFYNQYKKILRDLSLEDFNYHILRHTFATRCIENGFDPKTLSEILGHSNIKTTLSLYVHPSENKKIEYMNRLASYYF